MIPYSNCKNSKRDLRLNHRGTLLVMSLWMLLILTIFSVSVSFTVRQQMKVAERIDRRIELRSVAEAGVVRAQYILAQSKPDVGYDTLNDDWSSNEAVFKDIPVGRAVCSVMFQDERGIHYGMIDEERKVNIRTNQSPLVLQRLLEAVGLSEAEAYSVSVSIADWMDEDEDPHEGGAESRYYQAMKPPYGAKNRVIDTLEELLYVKGMTPELYDRIIPFVTLESSGLINLNTASVTVLKAVGFGPSLAEKVDLFRKGSDRTSGTQDDNRFANLADAADRLHEFIPLSQTERASFQDFVQSGQLSVRSEHFAIQSTARLRDVRSGALDVSALVSRDGQVLRWRESYSA